MPVFSWNLQNIEGRPQDFVASQGLRIGVQIHHHPAIINAYRTTGMEVSEPFRGTAIIDTGSTLTSIDISTAEKLGLVQIGMRDVITAAGLRKQPQYAFSIWIDPDLRLDCVPGLGCDLSDHDVIALVGMDLISRCLFVVNGPAGTISLAH